MSSKRGTSISTFFQKELSPAALEWPGLLIWIMANNDLVKKKPVALDVDTYERLSKLAAQLRIDNPGGGFVSMSTAVGVLLQAWDALEAQSYANPTLRASGAPQFTTLMVNNFVNKHFPLEPENETE